MKVEKLAWVSNWPHLFVPHLFVGTVARIQRDKSMDMVSKLLTTPNFRLSSYIFTQRKVEQMKAMWLCIFSGYLRRHLKMQRISIDMDQLFSSYISPIFQNWTRHFHCSLIFKDWNERTFTFSLENNVSPWIFIYFQFKIIWFSWCYCNEFAQNPKTKNCLKSASCDFWEFKSQFPLDPFFVNFDRFVLPSCSFFR